MTSRNVTGTVTPSYDAAGNVTNDGVNTTYLYDAEGRVCAVHGVYGMTGYQYDASGERVGKGTITTMSCDVTTNGYQPTNDYVLGLANEQVTEVAIQSGVPSWQHTNVMADGMLVATYDTVGWHFYLNDPLGSRRAQTDAAGQWEQNCLSLPYGDQLSCTMSISAPTEHHFTGKERDTESGLDYFGARYYASSMGRLMSPDWAAKAEPVPYAKLDDPQTLNLYSYVQNNPLSRFDDDGHDTYLLIWKPSSTGVGHAAIAVDNYKQVSVREHGHMTTKMVPDGTYTYRDLWPVNPTTSMSDYNKSFPALYQNFSISRDQMLNGDPASLGKAPGEGRQADGIARIPGNYSQDQNTLQTLAIYQGQNSSYIPSENSCSTFASAGVTATFPGLDSTEQIRVGLFTNITATTPDALFNATRTQPGVEVVRDPGPLPTANQVINGRR